MFRQFSTLFRGRAHESAEQVLDQNALTILRQQIRDCSQAVAAARKAITIAIAQNKQEIDHHAKIVARIIDLEERTIAAIERGKRELAREGAETIAFLEVERDNSLAAQETFETEIERLKRIVRQSELRLRDLQRGQRLATATEMAQRIRESAPNAILSNLKDAEETLARLQSRQMEIDAAANALDEMLEADSTSSMSKKLAAAGCGKPVRPSADDVLARLTGKADVPSD